MKVIEKDIREGEREEKLLQCIGQKKREREKLIVIKNI